MSDIPGTPTFPPTGGTRMEKITAKGQFVTMEFDGQFLIIRRGQAGAFMAGAKGERRIPVAHIASVNFKPASRLFRGHFQVVTAGGHAAYDPNPMTRGMSIAQDPNAAVFSHKANASFTALNAAIYEAQLN